MPLSAKREDALKGSEILSAFALGRVRGGLDNRCRVRDTAYVNIGFNLV
jgi:hypothetical protein